MPRTWLHGGQAELLELSRPDLSPPVMAGRMAAGGV